MRAIWSGEVSFGLVTVPIKLYSATQSHDLSLHQVHEDDGGRIRYERHCEVCGEKVDYKDIDKAYDSGESSVILTKQELGELPADDSKEIAVEQFVPEEQIDSMVLDKSYYLEPSGKSAKAYVLLRKTLEESSRVAIVTFTLRSKTRLGVLRVRNDVIVLQGLRWADELREPEFEVPKSRLTKKEQEMATSLVDSYAEDFDPERFKDEYQDQLHTLVEEKLAHGEDIDTDATFGNLEDEDDGDGNVIDLMEALKQSVDSRRKSSGKGAGESGSKGSSKGGGSKKQSGASKGDSSDKGSGEKKKAS
ncbi:non-homologous end joining protein Ku [Nesterenkonia sandarakina]|uniref:Non-homologous end joining protein Ku n=1 Tax=Nesterenkonia sandarakina TaxID=272918 RepID=A0A2T0YK65_9MICC|nr:Ku protein [Nesterenkonia sandarakina]PRZ15594.1 DNA end-binding protein Ku [Nesterenkonia sandarakina]